MVRVRDEFRSRGSSLGWRNHDRDASGRPTLTALQRFALHHPVRAAACTFVTGAAMLRWQIRDAPVVVVALAMIPALLCLFLWRRGGRYGRRYADVREGESGGDTLHVTRRRHEG